MMTWLDLMFYSKEAEILAMPYIRIFKSLIVQIHQSTEQFISIIG